MLRVDTRRRPMLLPAAMAAVCYYQETMLLPAAMHRKLDTVAVSLLLMLVVP